MKILAQTESEIFIDINREIEYDTFKTQLSEAKIVRLGRGNRIDAWEKKCGTIYAFIHASDYGLGSKTHFEIENSDDQKENLCRLLKKFGVEDNIIEEDYIKKDITFHILWYKHETRSCTVYKHLAEISNEGKECVKKLKQIFDFHNLSKRKKIRDELLNCFASSSDGLDEKIEECKKFEV